MDLTLINGKKYATEDKKKIIYQMISDIFVAEDDMVTIHEFCKEFGAKVTFRKTGTPTIEQLKIGTAAKPHGILAKSIQKSRLISSDVQALQQIIKSDKKLRVVLGLVGRWKNELDSNI